MATELGNVPARRLIERLIRSFSTAMRKPVVVRATADRAIRIRAYGRTVVGATNGIVYTTRGNALRAWLRLPPKP